MYGFYARKYSACTLYGFTHPNPIYELCAPARVHSVHHLRILHTLNKQCTVCTCCIHNLEYTVHFVRIVCTLHNTLCTLCADCAHPSKYSIQFVQIIQTLQSTLLILNTDSTLAPQYTVYRMYGFYATSRIHDVRISRIHQNNSLHYVRVLPTQTIRCSILKIVRMFISCRYFTNNSECTVYTMDELCAFSKVLCVHNVRTVHIIHNTQ